MRRRPAALPIVPSPEKPCTASPTRLATRRPPSGRRDLALWLSIATLALLGALYGADPAYRGEHYATADGERRRVDLPDGNRITLAPATQIGVRWHLRTRRATLHGGQARFAIAAAGYGPFEVAAGATSLRVIGSAQTVFVVRQDGDQVTVTVAAGQLEVRAGQQTPILLRGAQQLVSQGGKMSRVLPAAREEMPPQAAAG